MFALDDLHLYTTPLTPSTSNCDNNNYMLNTLVSEDEGNDHLGFAWHLFRSTQEIYATSTPRCIREQFDHTLLLVGIHKPLCTEELLCNPEFGKYHLIHNKLSEVQLLRGHKLCLRVSHGECGSFVVAFTCQAYQILVSRNSSCPTID